MHYEVVTGKTWHKVNQVKTHLTLTKFSDSIGGFH